MVRRTVKSMKKKKERKKKQERRLRKKGRRERESESNRKRKGNCGCIDCGGGITLRMDSTFYKSHLSLLPCNRMRRILSLIGCRLTCLKDSDCRVKIVGIHKI